MPYGTEMLDRINAIVLAVRDVNNCALFYRDKLGFRLDQLEEDEAYLTLGTGGGTVLALKSMNLLGREIGEDRIRPNEEGVKMSHCVVFVGDIDREYADLKQKGVEFIGPPSTKEGGWRTAHFQDPEANLWEISQRPKK